MEELNSIGLYKIAQHFQVSYKDKSQLIRLLSDRYNKLTGIDKIVILNISPTIKIDDKIRSEMKQLGTKFFKIIKYWKPQTSNDINEILLKLSNIKRQSPLFNILIDQIKMRNRDKILLNTDVIYSYVGDDIPTPILNESVAIIQYIIEMTLEDMFAGTKVPIFNQIVNNIHKYSDLVDEEIKKERTAKYGQRISQPRIGANINYTFE